MVSRSNMLHAAAVTLVIAAVPQGAVADPDGPKAFAAAAVARNADAIATVGDTVYRTWRAVLQPERAALGWW